MEIYIEKEFLDNFYLEFDEDSHSPSQMILANILRDYAEVEWLIDCTIESLEDFEKLKNDNPFFAARALILGPVSINSIKDHFFEKSICRQTLIFTQNTENWFSEAENKGALCFSFESYQTKIETLVDSCHFKIDLSEQFQGWKVFSNLKNMPFNKIIINDAYILTDQDTQRMDRNLFPLIKNIIDIRNKTPIGIEIFTKNLNPPQPGTFDQIKIMAEKRFNRLNSVFANYDLKFKIISNTLQKGRYDFHDRLIYLNFMIIDSPKGFNLEPHKKSNSQISAETIFDKYTYNRLRNHLKMHDDYLNKIKSLETLEFKYILS
jgi:hypothetical protein